MKEGDLRKAPLERKASVEKHFTARHASFSVLSWSLPSLSLLLIIHPESRRDQFSFLNRRRGQGKRKESSLEAKPQRDENEEKKRKNALTTPNFSTSLQPLFFTPPQKKQNFVVHRPRRGGPGLVPSPRLPAFARTMRPRGGAEGGGAAEEKQLLRSLESSSRFGRRSGPPARGGGSSAAAAAMSSRSLLLSAAAGGDAAAAFFDVTEYSVVESSFSSSSSDAPAAPAPAAPPPPRVFFLGTGGGLAAPGGGAFAPSAAPSPSSPAAGGNPRRTRRLAWTCNLCGGREVSPVNPLAWEKGSVFIRCARCDVVHKVRDNLKIFHELAGQVYPVGGAGGRGGGALPPEAAAAAEAALRKWNQGN